MRGFVVFSALLAVGLSAQLPGYNYNSGSSFSHDGIVGPIFNGQGSQGAGSASVPTIGGIGGTYNGGAGLGGGSLGGSGLGGGLISSGSGLGGAGLGGGLIGSGSGLGNGGLIGSGSGLGNGGLIGGGSGLGNGGLIGSGSGLGGAGLGGAGLGGSGIGSGLSGGLGGGLGGGFGPGIGGGFSGIDEAPRHEAPLISKQFYLHSAPEDADSALKTKHLVLGRPQKNYRVVFIKSPSSTAGNVRLSAEYAPQEEKTVIYVLTQKEHELDVNDIATPAPTQPSKPEVFFIKYKTPEEAAHAQHEIQKQYDILGGASQVSNEGTAPVTDVSGSLRQPGTASSHQSGVGYLPPAKH